MKEKIWLVCTSEGVRRMSKGGAPSWQPYAKTAPVAGPGERIVAVEVEVGDALFPDTTLSSVTAHDVAVAVHLK